MRTTRSMTWIFLILSAAFFCVRDFRWALDLSVLNFEASRLGNDWPSNQEDAEWIESLRPWKVPQASLQALLQRGEQGGDAQAVAFAALHLDDAKESLRAAERAVALDARLTWIGYYLVPRVIRDAADREIAAKIRDWLARLQAMEPDNALGFSLEADFIRDQIYDFPSVRRNQGSVDAALLSTQTQWLKAMEKVFSRPHYRTSRARLFQLERSVLQREGWATPATFLAHWETYPLGNLLMYRDYALYKVSYLAPKAEAEKKDDEAMRQYLETCAFGQRMEEEGGTFVEYLIGISIDETGAEALAEKLRKSGRTAEASAVAQRVKQYESELAVLRRRESRNANEEWTRLFSRVLAVAILVFGALSLLSVLYVRFKAWHRPQERGAFFQMASTAESYLPALLFVSCVGLFIVYAPYANNFHHYMTLSEPNPNLENLSEDIFPFAELFSFGGIALHSNFHLYLYWAAGGLAVLFGVEAAMKKKRGRRA